MNIRDKLKFIDQISKKESGAQKSATPSNAHLILPGTEVDCAFLIDHEFDTEYQHGKFRLIDALEITPHYLHLAGKDENLLELELKNAIFFDTETTGLSGGSGTYIFLAGLGYFEENKFIVKQFFLRHPGEEFAMLKAINNIFSGKKSVVSFNGKSFDWPLLKSRMVFHRIWRDMDDPIHLDLLHAARRVWKNSLSDCSLSSLEREILGVERQGDVPSWEIPQLYFQYLRNGDASPLLPVIYHNKIDILSLVSLTAQLYRVHFEPVKESRNEQELLNLASYYEKNRHFEQAMRIYNELLAKNLPLNSKIQVWLRLSFLLKKSGNLARAAEIWQEIIKSGVFAFEAYEEMAKYYEHRLGDFERAREIVLSCLNSLDVKEQLSPRLEYIQMKKAIYKRLDRLEKKLSGRL